MQSKQPQGSAVVRREVEQAAKKRWPFARGLTGGKNAGCLQIGLSPRQAPP
jgi:hypothetical protein